LRRISTSSAGWNPCCADFETHPAASSKDMLIWPERPSAPKLYWAVGSPASAATLKRDAADFMSPASRSMLPSMVKARTNPWSAAASNHSLALPMSAWSPSMYRSPRLYCALTSSFIAADRKYDSARSNSPLS